MAKRKMQPILHRVIATLLAGLYGVCGIPGASGYAFDQIVPDVRQPPSASGGSACPVPSHRLIAQGSIVEQWSTVPGTNPVTILTQDQTPAGRLNEIVITQSLAVWTGVSGTTLLPGTFAPVIRTMTQNACGFRRRELHLLRSGRRGFFARNSGVHARDHRRHHWSASRNGNSRDAGWADSGC
jgi:hypothetical protein